MRGALRGLRSHPSRVSVRIAVAVGVVVTLAAIFGAVYQVPAPTIWAAYGVAAVFVAGLILSIVVPGEQTAHTSYDELPGTERGPIKL